MFVSMNIGSRTIACSQGDITQCNMGENGAIVNAANKRLIHGGGVCGAIYRAAGSLSITRDLEQNGFVICPPGESVASIAGNLKAKYIFHTVGPDLTSGDTKELLPQAYRSTLELACTKKVDKIAAPAISTGIFGYPLEEAAAVSLKAVADFFHEVNQRQEEFSVTYFEFVLYDQYAYDTFAKTLHDMFNEPKAAHTDQEQAAKTEENSNVDDDFVFDFSSEEEISDVEGHEEALIINNEQDVDRTDPLAADPWPWGVEEKVTDLAEIDPFPMPSEGSTLEKESHLWENYLQEQIRYLENADLNQFIVDEAEAHPVALTPSNSLAFTSANSLPLYDEATRAAENDGTQLEDAALSDIHRLFM